MTVVGERVDTMFSARRWNLMKIQGYIIVPVLSNSVTHYS